MLLRKYLLSLLAPLAVLSVVAAFLPFATRAHVIAGTTVDDLIPGDAIAFVSPDKYPSVQERLASILQENTIFTGTGAVQVLSGRLEIPNPPFFDCDQKHSNYTHAAWAHVQWTVPAGTAAGAQGAIETHSGNIESKYGFFASFNNPSPLPLRKIAVHGSTLAAFGARLYFGCAVVLPLVFTVHTLWWFFFLRRERRARITAQTLREPIALPITFHPEPVFEWRTYTIMMLLFSFVSLFVLFIYRHPIEVGLTPPSVGILGVGLVIATGMFWLVRRNAVSLTLDLTHLGYARGRNPKDWLTAPWTELRGVHLRTVVEKGIKHEWVEIEFPDGKKGPIYHRTVVNYPLVRDTLRAVFAKHHPGVK